MDVSVIIPAYNASQTIGETLDSIAGQTRHPDEVIVIDDGSTDETARIASAHPLDPKVITTDNRGAASAVNLGTEQSHGDLVSFLDADDLWEPDKTRLQVQALQDNLELDAVFGQTMSFACPSVPEDVTARLNYVKGIQPGYLISTMMVRRSWIDEHPRFMDPSLKTGYFINWYSEMREHGMKTHMLDTLVHRRRIRPGTLSSRSSGPQSGLTKDFLEIARRALEAKRQKASD